MIQKILIIIGVLFILVGLLYPFLKDLGLGRLPGDIVIKKENSSFYFPIVTCIVVSVVVSLILMFFKIIKKPYFITLKIAFSAKFVDLQVRVGILPLIGLITFIV